MNAWVSQTVVVHGRLAVQAYVASLGEEAHEWLLALYVDAQYQLLAVDCVARGDCLSCPVPFWIAADQAVTWSYVRALISAPAGRYCIAFLLATMIYVACAHGM